MADKRDYPVKIEGFILGEFKAVGATARLTPRQAVSYLREGRIVEPGSKARRPASKTVGSDKS